MHIPPIHDEQWAKFCTDALTSGMCNIVSSEAPGTEYNMLEQINLTATGTRRTLIPVYKRR